MRFNLFHWLAGADTDILAKCSKSEQVKIAGFGTLVLIPAIVGFISMSYAISTLLETKWICFLGGLVWFFIVLFIDRFIVSTLYKSKLKDVKSNFILAVATRYLFAIFVGLAVAHPMVLLWFDDSITERIILEKDNELKNEETLYHLSVDSASFRLNNLRHMRERKSSLLTAELGGVQISDGIYGTTSGKIGNSYRAEEFRKQIKELDEQIADETRLISEKDSLLKVEKDKRKINIEENKSFDYLKRVQILSALEKDEDSGGHISTVKLFIILFFVFIDILPITMKIASPYGEYESIRDTKNHETITLQGAKREAIDNFSKTEYIENYQQHLVNKQKMENLSELSIMAIKLIEEQEKLRQQIYSNMQSIPESAQTDNEEHLNNLRDIFKHVSKKIKALFADTLN